MRYLPIVLILALLIPGLPRSARSAWTPGGSPVSAAVENQTGPVTVPDGAGGAIVAWGDYRSGGSDIYAQRIDATGNPLWTLDGVALCTNDRVQSQPTIVSDGAGGAIVAWTDYRNGTSADLYAQRVSAAGTVLWTADGVAVCTAADEQVGTPMVSDGAGGAIITWHDYRSGSGYTDIHAQRINASGTPQWTIDGVAICTAANHQTLPVIDTDGAGGAIIAWQDGRGGGNNDIYAQRVNAAGVPQWTADGVILCGLSAGQIAPVILSDGAGGAIVTWLDGRNGPGGDVYAQRVSALGSPQWTANGIAVCIAPSFQSSPTMASDGANGAIITWYDYRNGTDYNIYVQRVSNLGVPQWTANGVAVCTAAGEQWFPLIVSDGAGGALISWGDTRSGVGYDAYVQRVDATGTPVWAVNGISPAPGSDEGTAAMASDGAGGAIVAWEDFRNTVDYDIYALRLDASGAIPVGVSGPIHQSTLFVGQAYPNPFSATTWLDIEQAAPSRLRLEVFDVAGRRVRAMTLGEGTLRRVAFDGRDNAGRLLPSGIYFCRVEAAGETIARKMVIAR
ncbi:MAG: T9SS type A sorting domain-containing protein [Candidatus Krumholzibacteria bacterium]|nr:T9SS type A sorting domain-containing protein [Candidatus Krumholzibacteria bacterium]